MKISSLFEADSIPAEVKAAFKAAKDYLEDIKDHTVHENEEDEVGHFACCGEISYKAHSGSCDLIKLLAQLTKAEKFLK